MFRFGLQAPNFYDFRRLVVVISKSMKRRKPEVDPMVLHKLFKRYLTCIPSRYHIPFKS